jgi:transcriptional regulator with XRE-family HTH domain
MTPWSGPFLDRVSQVRSCRGRILPGEIARLEAGDHQPSLATLARLAAGLGMEFHIDITPETFELRETA